MRQLRIVVVLVVPTMLLTSRYHFTWLCAHKACAEGMFVHCGQRPKHSLLRQRLSEAKVIGYLLHVIIYTLESRFCYFLISSKMLHL